MSITSSTSANATAPTRERSTTSRPSLWALTLQEAQSVSAWMALATLLRGLFGFLTQLASYQETCSANVCESYLSERLLTSLSGIAVWLLKLVPSNVRKDQAPGFICSSLWLLWFVQSIFGSLPNLPLRITEYWLGRLRWKELVCVVIPIHFSCVLSTLRLLEWAGITHHPVEYATQDPYMSSLIREALATFLFCMASLVIPELFAVNGAPRWASVFLLYPIYNLSVDSLGKASTLTPNVLVMDIYLERVIGMLLGAVLAGFLMRRCFPDDPKE